MSETRETLIELPSGERLMVQTDDLGTQVHAVDGRPLAASADDTHADRVSEYTREGGKVVIGTGY